MQEALSRHFGLHIFAASNEPRLFMKRARYGRRDMKVGCRTMCAEGRTATNILFEFHDFALFLEVFK